MGNRATINTIGYNDNMNEMIRKLNYNFSVLNKDTTNVIAEGGGGSGNIKVHQDLGDSVLLPGCHPIAAITNLDIVLANKASVNEIPGTYKNFFYPKTIVQGFSTNKVPEELEEDMTWEYVGYTTTNTGDKIYNYKRTA